MSCLRLFKPLLNTARVCSEVLYIYVLKNHTICIILATIQELLLKINKTSIITLCSLARSHFLADLCSCQTKRGLGIIPRGTLVLLRLSHLSIVRTVVLHTHNAAM